MLIRVCQHLPLLSFYLLIHFSKLRTDISISPEEDSMPEWGLNEHRRSLQSRFLGRVRWLGWAHLELCEQERWLGGWTRAKLGLFSCWFVVACYTLNYCSQSLPLLHKQIELLESNRCWWLRWRNPRWACSRGISFKVSLLKRCIQSSSTLSWPRIVGFHFIFLVGW